MAGLYTQVAFEHLIRDECFTPEQAERILLVVKEFVTSELATRAVTTALKADNAAPRSEIKTGLAELRAEVEKLRIDIAKYFTKKILWLGSIVTSTVVLVKVLDYLGF